MNEYRHPCLEKALGFCKDCLPDEINNPRCAGYKPSPFHFYSVVPDFVVVPADEDFPELNEFHSALIRNRLQEVEVLG